MAATHCVVIIGRYCEHTLFDCNGTRYLQKRLLQTRPVIVRVWCGVGRDPRLRMKTKRLVVFRQQVNLTAHQNEHHLDVSSLLTVNRSLVWCQVTLVVLHNPMNAMPMLGK